jgi:uncharacterized membrane protein
MHMTTSRLWILGLVVLSFAVGVFFYPRLPAMVASHWNGRGQVDGYTTRFWGVFLLPMTLAGIAGLLLAIPGIDPLKANIARFRAQYDTFVLLVVGFLLYLHLLTLLWNLGLSMHFLQMLAPAVAIVFYAIGALMQHTRRNYFIGIRTPWTLSSDEVWDHTHKAAGKWFKWAGLVALGGVLRPDLGEVFILLPVVAAALYSVVYSYLEYQRLSKET